MGMCWCLSMCFFLYIVYELLVGLSNATNSESDPDIRGKISTEQVMTVISWCTYPIVYLFPMIMQNGGSIVVAIQIGYCASDIISKCGVGIVIYQISAAKSCKCMVEEGGRLLSRPYLASERRAQASGGRPGR